MEQNRLAIYRPYPKQAEFHAAGAHKKERALFAGNRQGKTESAAMETAMHLTGQYPDWWDGKRFRRAIRACVGAVSAEKNRDVTQRKLFGMQGKLGTGTIPASCITTAPVSSRTVTHAIDYALVDHVCGEKSWVSFRSYEQVVEKWSADDYDLVWFDEEPPADIYSEGVTRTHDRKGIVYLTFTPLLGMTEVVGYFYPEPNLARRHLTEMTLADAEHFTPEEKREIEEGYPAHEREARAHGIPMLGSGRVYLVPEDQIAVDPFPIPHFWPRGVGLDFGYGDHPSPAALCAWDRDADTFYVTDIYHDPYEMKIPMHAASIKRWGDLPVAWPHDALRHDVSSGKTFAQLYREQGLRMLAEHSHFADGGYGVEAGVYEIATAMQTGRFKVFRTCEPFWREFRIYHRKDGKIVPQNDDVLDAVRYAWMMRRFFRTEATGQSTQAQVADADWDPLARAGGGTYDAPEGRL